MGKEGGALWQAWVQDAQNIEAIPMLRRNILVIREPIGGGGRARWERQVREYRCLLDGCACPGLREQGLEDGVPLLRRATLYRTVQ